MIELVDYTAEDEVEILKRMADFFGIHRELYDESTSNNQEIAETLNEWISHDHSLFVILFEAVSVGFVHICCRGENVAWIEDIYVDRKHRGKGIASQAIKLSEEIIARDKNYDAVCIDAVPRNIEALKLYYRLGYTNLSMITVRKELYDDKKRDRKLNFLGFDYTY